MSNNLWSSRITNANKVFDAWESRFKCTTLEDYYRGFQWKGKGIGIRETNRNPYTINLFYSTIKIKLASLLFQRPSFAVSPRPGNSDWDIESAVHSAQIKEDVLNTIIQNPNANFVKVIKRAALDSFFRFGMVEVGYAADWRNPQKEPIYLKSHNEEDVPLENDKKLKPAYGEDELPVNERFYFRRIKPRRFRVSVNDAEDLNDVEWCGYYEYYYTRQLQKTPGIKWPDNYGSSESGQRMYSSDYAGAVGLDAKEPEHVKLLRDGEICKVWHIWDGIAKKRLMLLDGEYQELWSESYERLPFLEMRWDYDVDGFYPIPPSFQWISPQDEINEAREQTRSYRRRFTRKFQAVQGAIDTEEIEKFVDGPDGSVIMVKQPNAISAIDNPQLGPTTDNALTIAKDDFNIISGTSAEARGQNADRETATQAKIVDARAQLRESADQMDFSNWIIAIGRETLAQAAEKMSEGLWVKYTSDPGETAVLKDAASFKPYYKWIKAQDLSDGYDFDINVDINNATPQAMQQQQQAFISFLSLVQNYPAIAMSPILIREAAYRCGYRNEQVIHQYQQVAVLSMAAKAAQQANQQGMSLGQAMQSAQGQNGQNSNNAALAQQAQMATPADEQVSTQINNQLM